MNSAVGCAVLLSTMALGLTSAVASDPDPAPVADSTLVPPAGDFLSSPVYYELFRERYSSDDDADLLRSGLVRVQHFNPVDVTAFDWSSTSSTDYTWWMQMEEMRFLLPVIPSDRAADRALAKQWLTRWFGIHMAGNLPRQRWGEPMTWAYRAMVFVYYLKTELLRDNPDPDVVGMLRGAVLDHQEFLSQPGNFDAVSNHGLIDALGLLETTRVYADPAAIRLADAHLSGIVNQSVSPHGVHMEHAAYYHFVFLRWLDEIVEYATDVPVLPPETVETLRKAAASMLVAAYFLQDHDGEIPQIGDSDSTTADWFGSRYRRVNAPGGATTLYDRQAGYAIFKDRGWAPARRYVVLRQSPARASMTYHRHSDALAVLVAIDGETVLGDAGKFEYKSSGRRAYFTGSYAHNTVIPANGTHPNGVLTVGATRDRSGEAGAEWSADATLDAVRIRRTVRVPKRVPSVVVVDTVRTDAGATREALMLWNLGHDVANAQAELDGKDGTWSWVLTTRRGRRVRFTITSDASSIADVRIARGEANPMIGWYSPRHGVLRPISTIVVTLRVDGEARVESRLDADRHDRRRR